MLGVLAVDKPLQYSSQQVVQRIKRLYQCKKVGHGGALDVMATGLLPVFLGEATKFSQFALNADKTYRVGAKLGQRTATGDAEGAVIESKHDQVKALTESQIIEVIEQFKGQSQQIPSMYSALKYKGQPLYRLARQGIEVERAERTINVKYLTIHEITEDTFELEVRCSKGTYIRNLIDDVGQMLGCGAHVSHLRRTQVSELTLNNAFGLDEIEALSHNKQQALMPVDTFLGDHPVVELSEEQVKRLRYGQIIVTNVPLPGKDSLVRINSAPSQVFVGIAICYDDNHLKAKRLLAY